MFSHALPMSFEKVTTALTEAVNGEIDVPQAEQIVPVRLHWVLAFAVDFEAISEHCDCEVQPWLADALLKMMLLAEFHRFGNHPSRTIEDEVGLWLQAYVADRADYSLVVASLYRIVTTRRPGLFRATTEC